MIKNTNESQILEFRKAIFTNAAFSVFSLIVTTTAISNVSKSLRCYVVTIVIAILANLYFAHRFAFKRLRKVTYSYGNLYLFRRYAFLYEAFFAVSLSFLLGAFPILFEYLEYTDKTAIFKINFSTTWFGCNAAGAKCIIDYSKTIWEEEAKKRGEKLLG